MRETGSNNLGYKPSDSKNWKLLMISQISSKWAATLHGKNTRFRAPASSPSPAAATLPGKTPGFVLRLPPHNTEHATFMQPFQCDLQPRIQETHIELRTQEQPLGAEHRGGTKTTPAATAAHMRYNFIADCSHFTGKNTRFRAPASSPQHRACNIHAAIPMRSATTESRNAYRTTHTGTTTRCRTQRRNQNDPSRNRRTHEVPFIAGCSHFTRENARFRAPASSPQHRARNIHAAIPMRSATTDSRNAYRTCTQEQPPVAEHRGGTSPSRNCRTHKVGFLPTTKSMQHSCSHSNAICNHRFKKHIELRTQEQPAVAEHRRGTKTTPAATAAHTRYLSSPAAATLHGKTQGFVLRLPPHNTEHATFMQPFQCDLQPQTQETHRTTHTGTTTRCRTQRRNQNDPSRNRRTAAATLHGKTQGFVLRLPPHNTEHATFMQPFQCDLQSQIQETHRTTHTGTTTRCRTQRRNMEEPKRPQPQPPHTRDTCHRRLQPLYREKHQVSCSGFLPTTQSMQHSCSHSNAICNHRFKKRI